ncbi:MAG TPA: multicopper oxidase family protein [Gemmatimonadaceae bacterium]|nr:multicopper oxidase family protein [Gemmatimonadaceae bacterium]
MMWLAAPLLLSLAASGPARAATRTASPSCDGPQRDHEPSRDLYCIELQPTAGLERASGRVALGHDGGPFTVPVTAAGALRYAPTITLAGLPAPSSLGAFSVYVVWVATPTMDQMRRLGVATVGRTRLAPIDFDKFVVLVSAERSAEVREPLGRIVLRGMSASTRLQPPELMQFALGAMRDSMPTGATLATGRAHAGHGGAPAADSSVRWTTVPMPPGLAMLPAEMALRPATTPYLPRPGSVAPPAVRSREVVRLAHGDTLRLVAGLVSRTFKGRTLTMFGFNGQHPGPLLQVPQSAEVVVRFENALDQPSTVHWHGVRLDNRFDGIPGLTQDAVPPGGTFTYRVRFPDAGIYWYHPHVREDIQQELGLYGNMLVRSPRPDYFSPAHREEVLMLDDLLVGDDGLVPFGRDTATHALMGRFGNVFLVNGEPGYSLRVRRGEVVRFHLTNVSNTRTFNLSLPGARLKLVASDVGTFEREEWVESVVIAPAERYVVHARFDRAGAVPLVNRVHAIDHLFGRFRHETDTLGVVSVGSDPASAPRITGGFARLRTDTASSAELARIRRLAASAPQRTLVLGLVTRGLPFLTRQLMQLDSVYFNPVEWNGTMPSMNWASTSDQIRWVIRDPATGRENMDIDWRFRRGDVVRVRLVNERRSLHAMQHPIHFHGQRFVVLAVNGAPTRNLAWKDTVLIPGGATVDLLLELSNPGRWMAHCHIAEHLSADMMMGFTVQ